MFKVIITGYERIPQYLKRYSPNKKEKFQINKVI